MQFSKKNFTDGLVLEKGRAANETNRGADKTVPGSEQLTPAIVPHLF